jgi:hypothetical protein
VKNGAFPPLDGNKASLAVHPLTEFVHYHLKYTIKKVKSKIYRFIRCRAANRLFVANGLWRVVLRFFPAPVVKSPNRFLAVTR